MKYKLSINKEYEVEAESFEDALDKLEEQFAENNSDTNSEFWDNLEIHHTDCNGTIKQIDNTREYFCWMCGLRIEK